MCWLQAIQWKSKLSLVETFPRRLWLLLDFSRLWKTYTIPNWGAGMELHTGLTLRWSFGCGDDNSERRTWAAHKTKGFGGCGRRVSRMWYIQISPADHHLQGKAQKKWWSQQLCDTTTQAGFCTWLPHHAVAENCLGILPPSHALPGSWYFLLQSPALASQLHMVYLKKNWDAICQNHSPMEGTWELWLSALSSDARESQGNRRSKQRGLLFWIAAALPGSQR